MDKVQKPFLTKLEHHRRKPTERNQIMCCLILRAENLDKKNTNHFQSIRVNIHLRA
jgi:hypothetical protein